MAGFTVEVTGVSEVLKNLKLMGDSATKAAKAAIYQEAEEIMTKSKRLVPVDTGALKSTGIVELPKEEGNVVSVTLGYGGPAAPYALAVHENPRAGRTGGVSPQGKPYKHYAQTGQWKYLEQPAAEAQAGMDARIAARIRGAIK